MVVEVILRKNPISVHSEIGKLESVILHRPGNELGNLTPNTMTELLFDEIPYLKNAQKEHDVFAKVLEDNGVKVYYLVDLVAESISDEDVKRSFVETYLREAGVYLDREREHAKRILYDLDNKAMVSKMIEGIRKTEIDSYQKKSLPELADFQREFIIKPMPNVYFMRDPFSFIGNGVSLNSMWSETRRRETLFGKTIFEYHPMFKDVELPMYYDRHLPPSIEGGDIVVLSDKVVAVGISQRSNPIAIEQMAKNLLLKSDYETVLALTIPSSHAFMHLDTVFTMVDRDLFTLHPEVDDTLKIFSMSIRDNNLEVEEETSSIEDVLKKYLEIDTVELIRAGSGTVLDAAREQWSDGYNTLAIGPREVVVYDRNEITNEALERAGAKLHIIPSGELSRGRGGPRCMSMPLCRIS